MKRKTTEQFIQEALKINEDRYDYSLVEYKNNYTKVKIICKEHGEFEMKPIHHIDRKQGCSKCVNRNLTTGQFIEKAKMVFVNNEYDYSLVEYIDTHTKVRLICKEHVIFLQTPRSHLAGHTCLKCSGKNKKTTQQFIQESIKKHGDKYNYSFVEYNNCFEKVKIICRKHGEFEQVSSVHLFGSGCPICKCSKGEIIVKDFLDNNSIEYNQQQKFSNCKNKQELPFDFYLPYYNTCIEYNGRQHYESVNIFGGQDGFIKRKRLDDIKRQYCIDNNIKLLIIKYDEDIVKKIDQFLKIKETL